MSTVALSVCLSVCMLVTRVCCAKADEPIEMPFGGLTHLGPSNHDVFEIARNPFADKRGDKPAMRPFVQLL